MSRLNARTIYLITAAADPLLRSTTWIVGAVYYVLAVHMNPFQLVLVGTVLELSYLVFQVPTGLFADLVSRRASVVLGWLVLGSTWVLEGSIAQFWAILVGSALCGLGFAFRDGAETAWLADEVGDVEVGPLMVHGSQISQPAGIIGTIGGVGLASVHLNLPLVVGGAGMLAIGVFLTLTMPEVGFQPDRQRETRPLRAAAAALRTGVRAIRSGGILLTLIAVTAVWGASSEGFDRLWEAHLLRDLTLPTLYHFKPVVWFGIIGVANGLICTAVVTAFRSRLQRISASEPATARLLIVLYGATILSIMVFGLAHALVVALVALSVKAVMGTLTGPLYESWLVQTIDPRVRATVLSIAGQSNALGQIVMGPAIGAVGVVASMRAALAVCGLLISPILPLLAGTLHGERVVAASDVSEAVS